MFFTLYLKMTETLGNKLTSIKNKLEKVTVDLDSLQSPHYQSF